jgi:uncharacterized SAM-binding protein YcdF (DUF218 family)
MTVLGNTGRWIQRVLAGIGLLTVLIMTTPMVSWWAHAYSGPIEQPKGDILILLSAANDDKGLISYSSYWRARYALLAWQTGGFQKIVVSGSGGTGILDFLVAEGIPREDIVAEWQSDSTRENGINAARMVASMPGKKVLLTSDFHMYRAIRVFRKLGVDVTPRCTKVCQTLECTLSGLRNLGGRIHQDRLLPSPRLDITPVPPEILLSPPSAHLLLK